MAKTATAPAQGNGFGGSMKSWWPRTKAFYTDVRMEMKKVTTPSFKEVQSTTVVVIIAVFFFGVYFWAVDWGIGQVIDRLLRSFHH